MRICRICIIRLKGGRQLGFAKYLEDDIGIFNDRMYIKGETGFRELNDIKEESKKITHTIYPKKEYMMILNELNKLKIWLDIINIIYLDINTKFVIVMLDNQRQQLEKIKDEYINYIYDPKFKKSREDKSLNIPKDLEDYKSKIIESYIEYFIEKLRTINNHDDNDAIKIDNLYWDIEIFVKRYLHIDAKSLESPLIQHLREKILNEYQHEWIICSNCGIKTYLDFKTCIVCKYPKGVM